MMTLKYIKAKIKDIKEESGDDESQHSNEDILRDEVLRAIATGKYTIDECVDFSKEVLKTSKIDFFRWCA